MPSSVRAYSNFGNIRDASTKKELTDCQQETYEWIVATIKNKHAPPTYQEIADHFDVSLNTARGRVQALSKKGYLSLNPNQSRGIEVIIPEKIIRIANVNEKCSTVASMKNSTLDESKGWRGHSGQSCSTCHFFSGIRCCRYPPIVTPAEWAFPLVPESSWCGEYRQKDGRGGTDIVNGTRSPPGTVFS